MSRALRVMPDPIRRALVYEDHRNERRTIGEDEIPALTEPIVILGDPGLGKSVLTIDARCAAVHEENSCGNVHARRAS